MDLLNSFRWDRELGRKLVSPVPTAVEPCGRDMTLTSEVSG